MGVTEKLGNKIKQYRLSLKMTQSDFAERLGVTGASVSAYENGTRQPSFDVLVKIANILNTTTDDLLGRTQKSQRSVDVSTLTELQIRVIEEIIVTYKRHNKMYQFIEEQGDLVQNLNFTLK